MLCKRGVLDLVFIRQGWTGEAKNKGKKEKKEDKLTKNGKTEIQLEGLISNNSSTKKKKGGKNSRKDPADQFDPLNFKPTNIGSKDESPDMKSKLASYEFKCSACPFGTNLQDEFKSHFKCEWHKINLQRKVGEQEALTEDQFKEFLILREFA